MCTFVKKKEGVGFVTEFVCFSYGTQARSQVSFREDRRECLLFNSYSLQMFQIISFLEQRRVSAPPQCTISLSLESNENDTTSRRNDHYSSIHRTRILVMVPTLFTEALVEE